MNNAPTLVIFIKNPELGKAKTRLAESVGAERALQIYRALLSHTRSVTQKVAARRMLFYSAFIDQNDDWSNVNFEKHLQTSGGLGERMTAAFQQAFAQTGGPVLIVGSDCAQLTPAMVEAGIKALQEHDFVIGPAEDGGYYLLGMRAFHPEVFKDVAWSTETVLPQTLEIIAKNGWSHDLLPVLSDIDYEEDWEKHGWEIG